jgi:hypothetical protein
MQIDLEDVAGAVDDPGTPSETFGPIASTDLGAAIDGLQVVKLPITQPPAGTAAGIASPAFIRSQMPRMHVQNLLTGAWLHRDVQGITSPQITWTLNSADTFSCTLSPPRPDLLDASGEPIFTEWQTAIYLEEDDEIKHGGILVSSQAAGPGLQLTTMGFSGYPNGMPYEGDTYKQVGVDALDAVRFLWGWLQAQPDGNLNLVLDQAKAGVQLGIYGQPGAFTNLTQPGKIGDKLITLVANTGFSAGDAISIGSEIRVVAGGVSVPLTQLPLTAGLESAHAAGEPVLQRVFTTLSKVAKAGDKIINVESNQGFAAGQTIQVGNESGTIAHGVTVPATQLPLVAGLARQHNPGSSVSEATAPTPFELDWWNSTDIGQEIQSIQQEAVFDFIERHQWSDPAKQTVDHLLHFGVPRAGIRQTGLRFVEGENIVVPSTVTRDGTQFANSVIGLGAGTGSSQLRATVAVRNGRLRRVSVYADQTATTQARMQSKAQAILTAMSNIDTPATVTVINHPHAPFGSFMPGDDIPVRLASGWRAKDLIWCRITSMTQDPTTSLMVLTLARSDSFTYMAQTGQAGTI